MPRASAQATHEGEPSAKRTWYGTEKSPKISSGNLLPLPVVCRSPSVLSSDDLLSRHNGGRKWLFPVTVFPPPQRTTVETTHPGKHKSLFPSTSTYDYFPNCFGCLAKHCTFHSFLQNHPKPCMSGLYSKVEDLPRPGRCPGPCRIPPLQTLGSGLYVENRVALSELPEIEFSLRL